MGYSEERCLGLEVIKWLVTSNGLARTPVGHCDSPTVVTTTVVTSNHAFDGSDKVRNQLGQRKCVGVHII